MNVSVDRRSSAAKVGFAATGLCLKMQIRMQERERNKSQWKDEGERWGYGMCGWGTRNSV